MTAVPVENGRKWLSVVGGGDCVPSGNFYADCRSWIAADLGGALALPNVAGVRREI